MSTNQDEVIGYARREQLKAEFRALAAEPVPFDNWSKNISRLASIEREIAELEAA